MPKDKSKMMNKKDKAKRGYHGGGIAKGSPGSYAGGGKMSGYAEGGPVSATSNARKKIPYNPKPTATPMAGKHKGSMMQTKYDKSRSRK